MLSSSTFVDPAPSTCEGYGFSPIAFWFNDIQPPRTSLWVSVYPTMPTDSSNAAQFGTHPFLYLTDTESRQRTAHRGHSPPNQTSELLQGTRLA